MLKTMQFRHLRPALSGRFFYCGTLLSVDGVTSVSVEIFCIFFSFFQLTNVYKSFTKNTKKQATTEIYALFLTLASTHKTIRTKSLSAYAKAKSGLRRKEKYTARKLVATETVLHHRFAVSNAFKTK